jgi:hypothetical protein
LINKEGIGYEEHYEEHLNNNCTNRSYRCDSGKGSSASAAASNLFACANTNSLLMGKPVLDDGSLFKSFATVWFTYSDR